MDNEKMLFEKGCFLPCWLDDNEQKDEMPISQVHTMRNKDLKTLLSELDEINEHIRDVRERSWNLAKLVYFHNNGFANE